MFTFIHSILIDKDLCSCRNVSIKFSCAFVSFGDLCIFTVKSFLFLSQFLYRNAKLFFVIMLLKLINPKDSTMHLPTNTICFKFQFKFKYFLLLLLNKALQLHSIECNLSTTFSFHIFLLHTHPMHHNYKIIYSAIPPSYVWPSLRFRATWIQCIHLPCHSSTSHYIYMTELVQSVGLY